MNCRPGCGACCIAPSISSAIPGMPQGKPAGVRCLQLDEFNRCRLFGKSERPKVCTSFSATAEICAQGDEQAFQILSTLEKLTA